MKKFVIALIIIMVTAFILAGVTFYATGGLGKKSTYNVNEEKTYDIANIQTITISSVSTDINFILVDTNEITAKFYGDIFCYACKTPTYQLTTNKDSNSITMSTKHTVNGIIVNSRLKLDIYLPRTYGENLTINTISGDIKLSDVTLKQMNLKTISGDATLNHITFVSSSLHTISGNFNGDNLIGDMTYNSTSGDIKLTNYRGIFDGYSVSGNYNIHELSDHYTINVNATSGDTKLYLNENASISILFTTTSGDLDHNDFNVTIPSGVDNNKYHFEGKVGDGVNHITVHTVSGDLELRKN